MAPLDPTNTPRFKILYTVGAHDHASEVRGGTISPATLGVELDDLYNFLADAGILFTLVVNEVQYAPSGSNIFNAVTTGIEGNSYGSGTPTTVQEPQYFDFVGRSAGGRRTRFSVFGANYLGGDFRVIAGENPGIDFCTALLNGSTGAWFAIDGLKAVWKSYANIGVNAYWQRKVRP